MSNSLKFAPLEHEERCTIHACEEQAHYDVTVIGKDNDDPLVMPFCFLHTKHMIDKILEAGELDWKRGNYPKERNA